MVLSFMVLGLKIKAIGVGRDGVKMEASMEWEGV
jgi:hypothetical protein